MGDFFTMKQDLTDPGNRSGGNLGVHSDRLADRRHHRGDPDVEIL